MLQGQTISDWIEQGMPNTSARVEGDGAHFDAVIISSDFADKNTMQRHRMVYAALGSKMGNEIHALSMKTLTPEEANEE